MNAMANNAKRSDMVKSAGNSVNEGRELYNKESYELAIIHFQSAINNLQEYEGEIRRDFPQLEIGSDSGWLDNYRKAHKFLGYSFMRLKENAKAIEHLGKAMFFDWKISFLSKPRCIYPSVYSFRSISKFLLHDLASNSISLSSPNTFNDPFDCPIFSVLNLKKEEKGDGYDNSPLVRAYAQMKIRCFVCNTYIEKNGMKAGLDVNEYEIFLMWSHYADSHKGICIKYKFEESFMNRIKENSFSTLVDIDYDTNPLKNMDGNSIELGTAFMTKSKVWEYENEVRLLHYDPDCKSDYKALPLRNDAKIEAVYFGVKCSDADRKLIDGLLLGSHVDFYNIRQSQDDIYKLEAVRIIRPVE